MKSKKIILFSFLYEPELGGGAAVVVNQLAHLLVQRDHSVVVVTTWKGNSIKTEYIDGVKVIRIPPNNLYWVGEKDKQPTLQKIFWQIFDTWNPLTYRMAHQIILDEKPDIVHSHKLRGLSPSIWSAASSAGVKNIVHTCHDYELLSPEGFFMGRVGRLAQQQNPVIRPYQILRRNFSKLISTATAPSKFVMDYHQNMKFFPNANIRIIPNSHGINADELEENLIGFSKKPKVDLARSFLYLGRLDKAKGIDLLCQAFSRIAGDQANFKLRIAGWGPLDSYLREKYKAQKNIEFIGSVFGVKKKELFHLSDVLVAPSVFQEPFGIVVIEAFSNGIPVIASKTGAFPEIIQDGKTGFLFTTGSVDDLVEILKRVSHEPFLISSMAESCFDEARKYTLDNLVRNYLDIYEGAA
jgi:glycosyltransferase involved in cell wall biosynthesis